MEMVKMGYLEDRRKLQRKAVTEIINEIRKKGDCFYSTDVPDYVEEIIEAVENPERILGDD